MAEFRYLPDVPFATVDSEPLYVDLVLPHPRPRQPAPVLVWVHGGGWMVGSRSRLIKKGWLPLFAKEGYAVVSVGYRLSTKATFPAQIHDVKGAIRWVRTTADEYGFDPNRVAIAGLSSGGHLAALAGVSGDDPYLEGEVGPLGPSAQVDAVVALSAPTDFLQNPSAKASTGTWLHRDGLSPEARLLGGPVTERPELAQRANPVTYVNSDAPPFLIVHGRKDEVVPFNQAELLYEALLQHERDVTFVEVTNGNHGLWEAGLPYPRRPFPIEIDRLIFRYLQEKLLGKTHSGEKIAAKESREEKRLEEKLHEERGLETRVEGTGRRLTMQVSQASGDQAP